MTSVSMTNVVNDFIKADTNKDGFLSKQETAQEAINLDNNGQTDEYRLFATFIAGGSDNKGLFPDFYDANGKAGTDGNISLSDLFNLAAADASQTGGSADSISSNDLSAKFGSRASGGNTIKFSDIQAAAGTSSTGVSSDLLQQLLPILALFGGGGAMGGNYGNNPFGGNNNNGGYNYNPYGGYGGYGGYNQYASPYASQQTNPFSILTSLFNGNSSSSSNTSDLNSF